MESGLKPRVSCICPTYGRAHTLGESLDCFLQQTYHPRELFILNDAPVKYREVQDARLHEAYASPQRIVYVGRGCMVHVFNEAQFQTLGHKYMRLMELAGGDIICHWDDDDLYLPGHIESRVERLRTAQVVKPDLGYVLTYDGGTWRNRGIQGNVFEGQLAYAAEVIRRIPFQPGDNPCYDLLGRFDAERLVDRSHAEGEPTYVFRWDTRFPHGECLTGDRWRQGNCDFSEVLKAGDVSGYIELIGSEPEAPPAQ